MTNRLNSLCSIGAVCQQLSTPIHLAVIVQLEHCYSVGLQDNSQLSGWPYTQQVFHAKNSYYLLIGISERSLHSYHSYTSCCRDPLDFVYTKSEKRNWKGSVSMTRLLRHRAILLDASSWIPLPHDCNQKLIWISCKQISFQYIRATICRILLSSPFLTGVVLMRMQSDEESALSRSLSVSVSGLTLHLSCFGIIRVAAIVSFSAPVAVAGRKTPVPLATSVSISLLHDI